MDNIDTKTVSSFGDEWVRFNQDHLSHIEHNYLFDAYFHIFPWCSLPEKAVGFDMGCGSGRWALLVAPRVSQLTCIDPSLAALTVAQRKLKDLNNVIFLNSGATDLLLTPNSQDFGYSLGVLHHVPNTAEALESCVKMLKPGAPFLLYLYYRFDNRPPWYRLVWNFSDFFRKIISKMSPTPKSFVTDAIALIVYWPLSRLSLIGEKMGFSIHNWLLSSYRRTSFYTMRTDSRDRFGTPLEKRFTRFEIKAMMENAGIVDIQFSERFPYWCCVGRKNSDSL